jgi:hypothetical protein
MMWCTAAGAGFGASMLGQPITCRLPRTILLSGPGRWLCTLLEPPSSSPGRTTERGGYKWQTRVEGLTFHCAVPSQLTPLYHPPPITKTLAFSTHTHTYTQVYSLQQARTHTHTHTW